MRRAVHEARLATASMAKNQVKSDPRTSLRGCIAVALLSLCGATSAFAHIGPPYPIIENRKVGTMTVTVWSNPDVGTGSFFVIIDPPKGSSVPADMKVRVAVQPVSGRLPEKAYGAWREKLLDRV